MTITEWIFISIGLVFILIFTYKLLTGEGKGGPLRRVGRWLRRLIDAIMGMS